MPIKRGDLYLANLNPTRGSEQSGYRPVLVIQNDIGNAVAPTTIIAPVTTKSFSKEYPTNVRLLRAMGALKADSTVLLSQIRTIDKTRLEKKLGSLPESTMHKVNAAIRVSLAV